MKRLILFIKSIFSKGCIDKIYSISILVGSAKCNANCSHCAATRLRAQASTKGTTKNLRQAIQLCARYGGWSISLTSSGEPTLSPEAVTETLREIKKYDDKGIGFANINLFTNGFEIASNPQFKTKWLPLWKSLGLTAIAVSIHSVDYETNLIPYGLEPDKKKYPPLEEITKVIRDCDITPRITLLLNKGYVDNVSKYKESLDYIISNCRAYMITSWPVLNANGTRNNYTPSRWNLFKIKMWLWFSKQTEVTMGHIWGGGVFGFESSDGEWGSVRLTNYVSEHSPTNDFVRQLVLFQDGTLSYSWYQKGSICVKG